MYLCAHVYVYVYVYVYICVFMCVCVHSSVYLCFYENVHFVFECNINTLKRFKKTLIIFDMIQRL